jgi:putative NADPH-quinone reductase
MTASRVLVIQGHPDPAGQHFCHALAQRYCDGARAASREVRTLDIAHIDFPLLRSKREWESVPVPDTLVEAQQALTWADHLVIIFPLWLGDMPALLKGFLEQVARPGFAVPSAAEGGNKKKMLSGRSARIVVTMGMPAALYTWYFGAHSVKSLQRNILGFIGIAPVRRTLIGLVEGSGDARRRKWLATLQDLGGSGT